MNISKKTKIYSFFILISIIYLGFFTNFINAQNGNGEKTLYLNDKQICNETIFTDERKITPGDKIIKEFYIKNNNDFKCTIKSFIVDGELKDRAGNILEKDKPQFNNFMSNSIITVYYNGEEISKHNLSNAMALNFTQDNEISLEKDETKKFAIEYILNGDADNSIQGVEYKFNLGINYASIDGTETAVIDKGVGGVSLIQTGTFVDNKLLSSLGICLFVIGLILIFAKGGFKKKI